MDIQLLGRDGKTIHTFKITEGVPDRPPEVINIPKGAIPEIDDQPSRCFVRAVAGNPAVYRPAHGVLEFNPS